MNNMLIYGFRSLELSCSVEMKCIWPPSSNDGPKVGYAKLLSDTEEKFADIWFSKHRAVTALSQKNPFHWSHVSQERVYL